MLAKILATAFFLVANTGVACSCGGQNVELPPDGSPLTSAQIPALQAAWYSRSATTIVRARIVQQKEIVTPKLSNGEWVGISSVKHYLSVLEVLKGAAVIGERVLNDYHSPCGVALNPNEEWILFLHGDQPLNQCDGHIHLNMNRATRRDWPQKAIDANSRYAQKILTALREAKFRDQLRIDLPALKQRTALSTGK